MTVSPKTKPSRTTLQSQLDDALADAAGLEAELEDEQKKVAELELKLNSVSSGVEYAEEYAAHNKKRNDEMGKLRRKLDRRDCRIAGLVALNDQYEAELVEASDKIAEHAQELVRLRAENLEFYEVNVDLGTKLVDALIVADDLRENLAEANAESVHNAQAANLTSQHVDALDQVLESQYSSMMAMIDARGETIAQLQSELVKARKLLDLMIGRELTRASEQAANEYITRPRRGYLRGAFQAARDTARLLATRGGAR